MEKLAVQEGILYNSTTSEVVVRRRNAHTLRTPFSAVAALTNKKHRRRVMDAFDLLDQVSKGAFSVFNNLKYNRSEDMNITRYAPEHEFNKTEKESLSRRIHELKKVGLIRCVKKFIAIPGSDLSYTFKDPRSTFIINPEMIRCTNHDEAEQLWLQCAKEKNNE